MADLRDLYRRKEALWRAADEARAAVHDCEAEIADAEGEPLRAAWQRAESEALRTNGDRSKAHRAFILHMADAHVRAGTVPPADTCSVAEIEQAMDEIRSAGCQHEDDGGPFSAKCRKCGTDLDGFAGSA